MYYVYKIKSGEEWNGQSKITDFRDYELIKITDDVEEAYFLNKREDVFIEVDENE